MIRTLVDMAELWWLLCLESFSKPKNKGRSKTCWGEAKVLFNQREKLHLGFGERQTKINKNIGHPHCLTGISGLITWPMGPRLVLGCWLEVEPLLKQSYKAAATVFVPRFSVDEVIDHPILSGGISHGHATPPVLPLMFGQANKSP